MRQLSRARKMALMRELGLPVNPKSPFYDEPRRSQPTKEQRLKHLASKKGQIELAEALAQISGEKAGRISGAKTLASLKPVSAFEPLLTAVLRESDDAVKLEFLKALRAITNANLEGSNPAFPPAFEKGVESIKSIIFTGELPLATEAVWILYGCTDDKNDESVLRDVLEKVKGKPIEPEVRAALDLMLGIY